MASMEGLVPITRAFLAQYYDKYPFELVSDVPRLTADVRSVISYLMSNSSLSEGESNLVQEVDHKPPHKIDENLWKNREHIEEVLFLLERSSWPPSLHVPSTAEDSEMTLLLEQLKGKFENTLKMLEYFQAKNADFVFNTVMSYMPQDFRGTLIRQQRERSERNRQAVVDALVKSGGSIRERYSLLWEQQMERRRQLAQLGSATGVYKTLVKYLVGVPQVLLDFIQQINDDEGPMEEQRQRYGPPLYSLTTMVLSIRLLIFFSWGQFEVYKLNKHQLEILVEAAEVYTSEFERFVKFMREVFANSPFFIPADEVGPLESRNEVYKEISIGAGRTYEVELAVESVNSYIAWDFSLEQGKLKLDIGFRVEYTNDLGEKVLILPYRRCESDQGNFCTLMAGNYKLIWDNSYATFFSKVLRYKVDCMPPDQ
ncbi:hypothetical protein Dimus_007824 [Dionaea muscipula]